MGRTANIIIKDVIHIFASISKIMRILLMGRRNHERWVKSTGSKPPQNTTKYEQQGQFAGCTVSKHSCGTFCDVIAEITPDWPRPCHARTWDDRASNPLHINNRAGRWWTAVKNIRENLPGYQGVSCSFGLRGWSWLGGKMLMSPLRTTPGVKELTWYLCWCRIELSRFN